MTTYIISDTHFGHHHMATKFRGFDSVEAHDAALIALWNLRVRRKDTVWLLGDVAFGTGILNRVLPQLNGHKKLLLGNHDQSGIGVYANHFGTIRGSVELEHPTLGRILLSHYPVHPQELNYGIEVNVHGHIHDPRLNLGGKYLNVNADVLPCQWEPFPWGELNKLWNAQQRANHPAMSGSDDQ